MNKLIAILIAVSAVAMLAGCGVNPTLLHEPDEYAKMQGVEVLTREPTRPYEVLITTKASGGRHTAISTMINAMIDDAKKEGADALIPLAGAAERPNVTGLEVFSFIEQGHTVTWARAIKWKNSR
jgi:hypothetical protein